MEIKAFVFPPEILEQTDVLCLFGFSREEVQNQLEEFFFSPDKEVVFVDKNENKPKDDEEKGEVTFRGKIYSV